MKKLNKILIQSNLKGNKGMEFEKIRTIISDVLNVSEDEVSLETTFVQDLGADSLDVLQIIMEMETEFGLKIEDEDLSKIVTVGDAVEQIKNAVKAN